jgi:hypothetical protein
MLAPARSAPSPQTADSIGPWSPVRFADEEGLACSAVVNKKEDVYRGGDKRGLPSRLVFEVRVSSLDLLVVLCWPTMQRSKRGVSLTYVRVHRTSAMGLTLG